MRRTRIAIAGCFASSLVAALAFAIVNARPPGEGSETRSGGSREKIRLVWHVESLDGLTIDTRDADEPINPASIVKLATSLWALERLGPDHRFETRFGVRGSIDPVGGVLRGDLEVEGSGDPDFHVENAYLVGRELNRLGLREVTGSVIVNDRFWIGWEGGSARRERDALRRRRMMASRLRDALDPRRWDGQTRRILEEFVERRKSGDGAAPRIEILGGATPDGVLEPERYLLLHRSSPLTSILKRFNAYSNNDIERLESSLGPASDLAAHLARRWELAPSEIFLASHSGLGSNRMTPRQIVRILRDLWETCRRLGLAVEDILPVPGCDPGTLDHFPRLLTGGVARAVVAKTGTLTSTDGGIAVLAGIVRTVRGERAFCVAAPGIGRRAASARKAQEQWLLDLIARLGGPSPGECGAAVLFSDADARITAAP